nr:spore coat U domain-containing protein [Pseudomonas putida]
MASASRFVRHWLLRSNSPYTNKEYEVKERFLAALLGLLPGGCAVAADFLVEVRVQVQRGCMLVGQQRDAGAQALGRIDLGSTARLDGPGAPVSGVLLSQRPPRLECNPDTPYQVRVDGGQHGGAGELRFLASEDAKARPIPYRLYRDAAWREPVAVEVSQAARVPDSGTVELPLYARIDRLAWVPRAGQYADLLKVTVTW